MSRKLQRRLCVDVEVTVFGTSSSSSSEPLSSLSERGATSYLQRNKMCFDKVRSIYRQLRPLLKPYLLQHCFDFRPCNSALQLPVASYCMDVGLELCHFLHQMLCKGRHDAYPGFISSQASSCPALGASTPVRIFPLSTWMTFTGRSLI